jgi:hypothetical protein
MGLPSGDRLPGLHHPRLALVFEPVALPGDRHDLRVVQQPIQQAAVSVASWAKVASHWPNDRLLVTIRLPFS